MARKTAQGTKQEKHVAQIFHWKNVEVVKTQKTQARLTPQATRYYIFI